MQNTNSAVTKEESGHILDFISKYKELYLDFKVSNNLSQHTINNINLVLDRFYDYVADESSTDEITINDMTKYFLSNYLNALTNKGMSKSTQKLHIIIIKNFFKFIADHDIEKFGHFHDKFNGIRIRTVQRERVGLLEVEQLRLLNFIKTLDSTQSYLAQRNALLVKALLYTGLRISELINIKWTDLSKMEDKVGILKKMNSDSHLVNTGSHAA